MPSGGELELYLRKYIQVAHDITLEHAALFLSFREAQLATITAEKGCEAPEAIDHLNTSINTLRDSANSLFVNDKSLRQRIQDINDSMTDKIPMKINIDKTKNEIMDYMRLYFPNVCGYVNIRRRRVGLRLLPSPSSWIRRFSRVGGGAARASSSVLDHAAPMTPCSLLFPPPSPEHNFDDLVNRRALCPYCCITPPSHPLPLLPPSQLPPAPVPKAALQEIPSPVDVVCASHDHINRGPPCGLPSSLPENLVAHALEQFSFCCVGVSCCVSPKKMTFINCWVFV
nr:uncharacterized protein LOC120966213 [Aegilops tauschii subsp. strangulata]